MLVDGVDVRKQPMRGLRAGIGYVPQETFLFSETLFENIRFGRPDAPLEEVVLAARAAQAEPFIEEMPLKYETVVGERGIGLSGGQKQRTAIARALLMNPSILILDEFTSSVDVATERLILRPFALDDAPETPLAPRPEPKPPVSARPKRFSVTEIETRRSSTVAPVAPVATAAPVTLEHFARARVEGTRRVGRLLVPDLTLTVRGDAIVASFTLSKGAFATVVMRELMKVDDDHLSVIAEDDE